MLHFTSLVSKSVLRVLLFSAVAFLGLFCTASESLVESVKCGEPTLEWEEVLSRDRIDDCRAARRERGHVLHAAPIVIRVGMAPQLYCERSGLSFWNGLGCPLRT